MHIFELIFHMIGHKICESRHFKFVSRQLLQVANLRRGSEKRTNAHRWTSCGNVRQSVPTKTIANDKFGRSNNGDAL